MNVILVEMKKIWNPVLLFAITVICVLIVLSVRWNFVLEPPEANTRSMNALMTENYGTVLNESELMDFVKLRDTLIKKADDYIRKIPVFTEAGIYSYADFYEGMKNGMDSMSEIEKDAFWTLYGADCEFVGVDLITIDSIEGKYIQWNEQIENQLNVAATEHTQNRLFEIRNTGEYLNIMDEFLFKRTQNYMLLLAILTLLSSIILVSPLIVTDRIRNVHILQYTSKQGRYVLEKQLIAVFLSSLLLTTLFTIMFMVMYVYYSGDFVFWDNGLTSFESLYRFVMRIPVTLGQYIIVSITLLYVINAGISILAVIISRFSHNFVILLLRLLPIFSASVLLWFFVKERLLLLIDTYWGNSWLEFWVCGFLALICLTMAVLVMKKEKRIDIL